MYIDTINGSIENDELRQYIIFVRGYDKNDNVNKTMSIKRHRHTCTEKDGYYLTYSRNKYEITTSNGYYYEPVFISKEDYDICVNDGFKCFIREKKLETLI
jgi:hypothetical protein